MIPVLANPAAGTADVDDARGRPRPGSVRAVVAESTHLCAQLAALLAIFLVVAMCGYRAYLASAAVPDAEGPAGVIPPQARRVVVFIIDGFNPAHAFDPAVMPHLTGLAREGASGIARTGPVSLTAPGIFALMTGRPGDLVQAVLNFHATDVRGPSLPRAVVHSGKRIVLSGDKTWAQQFGWLAAPADVHVAPELGITLDPRFVEIEQESVAFLLGKLHDPGVGLLAVHVVSSDAVGHLVTPSDQRYLDRLHAIDALVGDVARAAGSDDTLLLVTGDHGMGARGSHGGAEEEARLTAYALRGPGVKPGVVRNISQTGVTPTLAVLLGLPLPVISEHPPQTELLSLSSDDARRLTTVYLDGKAVAAGVPPSAAADADGELNGRLNAILFGGESSRSGARAVTALLALVGVVAALGMARDRASGGQTTSARDIGTAALPLVALALVGDLGLRPLLGQNLPYERVVAVIDIGTLLAMGALAAVLVSPRFRALVGPPRPSHFFAAAVVASAPLLGSPWRSPAGLFELLLFGALAICVSLWRTRIVRWVPVVAMAPVGLAVIHYLPGSGGVIPQWVYVAPLSIAVMGLAGWNLRSAGRVRGGLGFAALCLACVAGWAWRAHPVPELAAFVLFVSLGCIGIAALVREPTAAGTLLIGASACLFLIMADFGREALVLLAAACGALIVARFRLELFRLRVLYLVTAVAILLRLCLFFQLGDEYMISGIRTAAGFRLVESGFPALTVISVLVLKYTLPWLVILGAVVPSLAVAGRAATRQVILLIALTYVARLALVATAADPLRMVSDGVQAIVGIFCISWAEFLTFALAAATTAVLVERAASSEVRV